MTVEQQLRKVRGEKIYAADLRFQDFGWASSGCHAVIIRSQDCRRQFERFSVNEVPPELRPDRLVSGNEIADAGIPLDAGWLGKSLFCLQGNVPAYVGHPLGIAYFHDWHFCKKFKEWLRQGSNDITVFSSISKEAMIEQNVKTFLAPLLSPEVRNWGQPYGAVHHIRIASERQTDPDIFSQFNNGFHDPTQPGDAQVALQSIQKSIIGKPCVDRMFSSETNDPSFLEPENGIAFWDSVNKCISIVFGTQSPEKDREGIKKLFKDNIEVDYKACPPGGGFGGRDLSSFPLYLAIAAFFVDDALPVRLAFDRFEQFQCGIKRHAFAAKASLHYNDEGQLLSFQTKMVFNGGGTPNLTSPVIGLAALQSAGAYVIPKTVISSYGFQTHGATSGSMRGFGIPQATLVIESLLDEMAISKGLDPINIRLNQIMTAGQRDVTGYMLEHHIGVKTICEMAAQEPLWIQRHERKVQLDDDTYSYGVGFACCMESYGTSRDAVFAAVEISVDGPIVYSSVVDMGQGSTTSVAEATSSILGCNAKMVTMGEDQFFDALGLEAVRDRNPTDPSHTPKRGCSSSASMTAFFHLHAVREACKIILEISLKPAAFYLWNSEPGEITCQLDGSLAADGLRTLQLEELLEMVRHLKLPTGAMVHTYFQGHFSTGTFKTSFGNFDAECDAIALKVGNNLYSRIDRGSVTYPGTDYQKSRRTLYAGAAHMVAVKINRRNGRVSIEDVISFLDPGTVHNEKILRGQVEGGFVMGLGMALTEQLPVPLDGVAKDWNWHRYFLPRITDVPLKSVQQLRIVPYEQEVGSPVVHKGIAEATMSTVPAAILNAIAHAINRRLTQVPVQASHILNALED